MRRVKIFIALLILSRTMPAFAADYALPKNFILALPQTNSVKVQWVAPPLPEKQVAKAGFSNVKFCLGPRNKFWMAHEQQIITDLSTGFSVKLNRPILDFVFLPDGGMFAVSTTHLGIAVFVKESAYPKDASINMPFQPICALPAEQCGIYADKNGAIFVYGYEKGNRTYGVFELTENFSVWRKIFNSADKISAVCADEDNFYAAAGRMVFKIPRTGGEGKIIFSHPMENIGSLTVTKRGVFYATNSGVGNISEKGVLEFMKAANCQLLSDDNKLYVILPESLGILQYSGADPLEKNNKGKGKNAKKNN